MYRPIARTMPEIYYDPNVGADDNGYVNQYGLGRKHIFNAVQASLERLGLDYIDVLLCKYLH
jgi:aryl-alcohol dehydrogenase-like predicted oxidoreductase